MFYLLLALTSLLTFATAAPTDTLTHTNTASFAELKSPEVFALPHLKSIGPAHVQIHEPVLSKVGHVVESVPTAVSHQSSTVVHSRAQRVTPIVVPAVRTYNAPLVEMRAFPLDFATSAAYYHPYAPLPLQWRTYPYIAHAYQASPHGAFAVNPATN